MQLVYPGINPSISDWKGQEIIDFQEELRIKANAHISEKWFYTHIKTENRSLPRIDILNLLSVYAGYQNWDDFKFKNSEKPHLPVLAKKGNRYFVLVPLLAIVVVGILYLLFRFTSTREYRFEFYDADTREPIINAPVSLTVLLENQSPITYFSDTTGAITFRTDESQLRMVIKCPYYQTDTVTRILKRFNTSETIRLQADDYALMLCYYAQTKVKDWKKRRDDLSQMIHGEALIYQVFEGKETQGMRVFTREEFIDFLTVPSGSLKNMEILDTRSSNEKIISIRFRVNTKKP